MGDNADSNDTAIKAIMREVDPRVRDIAPYRSRCLGHIINLAAKAFLFGKDSDAFEAIAELVDDKTSMDSPVMRDTQAAWHKKGSIGKLHNVVVFIRSSPIRREAFLRVVVGGKSNGKSKSHICGAQARAKPCQILARLNLEMISERIRVGCLTTSLTIS